MVQERKFCDYCGGASTGKTSVNSYSFDLTRHGEYYSHTKSDIELCDKCFKKYVQPLIDVLNAVEEWSV